MFQLWLEHWIQTVSSSQDIDLLCSIGSTCRYWAEQTANIIRKYIQVTCKEQLNRLVYAEHVTMEKHGGLNAFLPYFMYYGTNSTRRTKRVNLWIEKHPFLVSDSRQVSYFMAMRLILKILTFNDCLDLDVVGNCPYCFGELKVKFVDLIKVPGSVNRLVERKNEEIDCVVYMKNIVKVYCDFSELKKDERNFTKNARRRISLIGSLSDRSIQYKNERKSSLLENCNFSVLCLFIPCSY
jgi:hypothetical protein